MLARPSPPVHYGWLEFFFAEGFDEGLIFFFFYGISIDISVDGLFRAEKEEVWEGVHH